MAITMIRDLNDGRPCDTASWLPCIAHCPTIGGGEDYCVAWGSCYASLSSGVRPHGWLPSENTDENGVMWFATLEAAESHLATVEESLTA